MNTPVRFPGLMALAALSIFSTVARAGLEAEFVAAGQSLEACTGSPCFAQAKAAFQRYQNSRPDHPSQDPEETASGPRAHLHSSATAHAFLLVHSYTHDPGEMEFLAKELHRRGHNVISILLEGHGPRGPLGGGAISLAGVSPEDWREDFRFGARVAHALGRKVHVVGYSLGGLLALLDGMEERPLADSVLAIAPPVAIHDDLWGATGACAAQTVRQQLVLPLVEKFLGWDAEYRAFRSQYIAGACSLLTLVTQANRTGRSAGAINRAFQFEHLYGDALTRRQKEDFRRLKIPYALISSPKETVVDHATLERLTRLSRVPGTLFLSAAEDHQEYGLGEPGSADRAIFLRALDWLEKLR